MACLLSNRIWLLIFSVPSVPCPSTPTQPRAIPVLLANFNKSIFTVFRSPSATFPFCWQVSKQRTTPPSSDAFSDPSRLCSTLLPTSISILFSTSFRLSNSPPDFFVDSPDTSLDSPIDPPSYLPLEILDPPKSLPDLLSPTFVPRLFPDPSHPEVAMAYLPPEITSSYHRALLEPILYTRDAVRGLSVLWAAARGDQGALRKAIGYSVSVDSHWPRKWRSPWKTTCHPKWRFFDEKLKGYTALHIAAVFGRTDVAATLLGAGAATNELAPICWRCNLEEDTDALHDVTPRTATRTPLHFAVCYTNYDVAKELLRHGARIEVDGPNIRHWSVLHDLNRIRLPSHATTDFADWIMNKCHADLELVDSHNKAPLATACEAGQFRLARKLLSLGANPHAASPGTTLAHFALQTCGDMGTRPLARDEGTPETYSRYIVR
ncbi:Ankyrin-2 [Colletotrichum fructicola Nara gc5]|uniref:Ankyrin-2 n=1 Tax=Colletotrichum fructicola (strain Nara gc5) TaxID=1213859 RepID=A0A7J6IH48_COLFN|nr:Ankyrin-2 [Colletotrichum fructicola Nara gc5]